MSIDDPHAYKNKMIYALFQGESDKIIELFVIGSDPVK